MSQRTNEGSHRLDGDDTGDGKDGGGLWWKILLGLLVLVALVVAGFFLLGGDADVDVVPGAIEAPEVDVDVDGPDVDVETPDVDVDPGSVDVDDADAEAEAGG